MPKANEITGQNLPHPDPRGRVLHKITYQGKYLKWQYPEYHTRPLPVKKRGKVTHFSRDSRFRIFCLLNQIDWDRVGKSLFMTFTYPNFLRPNDNDSVNVHRALLARYIEKRTEKDVAILWRTEWVSRKTGCMRNYLYPHIHFLAFNVQYLHFAMVNRWWHTILGLPYSMYVRTETKRAKGPRGCGYYVSEYIGKCGSLVIGPYLNNPFDGRQWGVLRRDVLPVHARHYAELVDSRWMQELHGETIGDIERNEFNNRSFTKFGERASACGDAIFGMAVDGEVHSV